MRFEIENKALFNAFGSILYARGIKVEYIDDNVFVGEGYGYGQRVFYVRPKNGIKFSYPVEYIKANFTIINIDGYQFAYEDFIPYENTYDTISPDMIMFTVWEDVENVLKGLEFGD